MKVVMLFFLILLPLSAFADYNSDGFVLSGSSYDVSGGTESDDITITVINTFSCNYSQHILGLDFSSDSNDLVFMSNIDNMMYICNPNNGNMISGISLDYATDPHPWGVCVDGTGTSYINDFEESYLHWRGTSGWFFMDNPAGKCGKGMDFDGTRIWETYEFLPDKIVSFNTDGTGVQFYGIPELGSESPSGLTTFPYGSDTGIMVTSYDSHYFYFYSFNGSTLTHLGSVSCPVTCSSSYGLTYSSIRDTFFWSYKDSSNDYWITELDIEIPGTSLAPATWGSIKTTDFN